jgi:threonine/homoserine/homoserine lactone efflux protein
MSSFLLFLSISVVVIVTPGPDTAVTIRNTLFGGRTAGIFTALGVSTGLTVWATATSIGVVSLLVASEPLFLAVKYAGAAYLVVLGLQALWVAIKRETRPPADVQRATARLLPAAAFRQGLISDLGNPKIAVFFASLLPQFAPADGATVAALLSLGIVFAAITFVWLVAYAVVVGRAGDFLRRPGIRRAIEGVTGAVLIALGIRLAAEQR